ncbi:hypothetical protein OHA45_19445 [Streptomyces lydicus]|uniref:hypothetical protein n=1 Tax=Streptomyces lydicus TaxID=47763 RepID=UPI002E32204E|nr:hypothetical protein [Streptomyces lydicus]
MKNRSSVVVHPPDDRGLREVSIRSERVGKVWSLRELRKLLRRLGFPANLNVEDRAQVRWEGGDSSKWPDRPWIRRTTAVLITIGLLVAACVLLKIGARDTLGALTYTGRVEGASFLVAALVEGVAVIGVFDFWCKRRLKYSGAVILVGVSIALLADLLLIFVHLYGGEYTHYLWLWLALLLWALWALRQLEPRHILKGISHPKGFTIGAVASAIFIAANFAYAQIYLPYATPVLARVIAKLGTPHFNQKRTVLYLPVELHYQNSGKVGFIVLGSQYWVYGRAANFSEKPNGMKEWKNDLAREPMSDLYRHVEVRGRNLISAGGFFRVGNWLDPDEEFIERKVVALPADANYDTIEVTASATAIRADRAGLGFDYSIPQYSWDSESPDGRHLYDAPSWVAKPGDEYISHRARIYYGNEILNITRKPRYVTYWWVIPKRFVGANPEIGDTGPYAQVAIATVNQEAREPNSSDYDKFYNRYGLQDTYSPWAREPLTALLKAAGG